MRAILVVGGPSGAGKSTVCEALAARLDRAAHVRSDAFLPFLASCWVDPALPESAHQSEVLGAAVAAAAIELAVGGYTVLLDGHGGPDTVEGMAPWCARRGVALHYAALRVDAATARARIGGRRAGDVEAVGAGTLDLLHARFDDLGRFAAHAVDATRPPDEVAAEVAARFEAGVLLLEAEGLEDLLGG